MQDNQRNWKSPDQSGEIENHRIGRELHRRDQEHRQSSHRPEGSNWDGVNNFHTGYSNQSRSHFPEDTHQRTSNADRGASLSKHYGEREYSVYRNPNSLNYGDGRGNSTPSSGQQGGPSHSHNSNQHFAPYGDGRGNYSARQDSYGHGHDHIHSENRISEQRRRDDSNENYYRGGYMDSRGVREELPRPDANPYNEYPGSRSRYKDDDYRYGSGNHDWYQEHRYTANDGRRVDHDKGDVLGDMGEGLREAWYDIKHGVQNMFNRSGNHGNQYDNDRDNRRNDQDHRRNNHEYRSRDDRGYERGPRWSDESDTGDDSFFYNRDNTPRYY
ncbi:hypothetical protein [Rufibacter psychrotolerans]|uniref:hypothetical protein n=1 Tax=Rufibacter psychrotolerans TaxID=2812556 RepID=UPI001966D825|nr:hypothetical protein [Rufibacter sp. SYSU D00308]